MLLSKLKKMTVKHDYTCNDDNNTMLMYFNIFSSNVYSLKCILTESPICDSDVHTWLKKIKSFYLHYEFLRLLHSVI